MKCQLECGSLCPELKEISLKGRFPQVEVWNRKCAYSLEESNQCPYRLSYDSALLTRKKVNYRF